MLDDLSAALGAPASATLGAHQAVGQLVAIRYGAALASLSLAGLSRNRRPRRRRAAP